MKIISFKDYQNINDINIKDETERNIGYNILNDVLLTGRNNYYPNVLLFNNNKSLISPYDEKIMSLNKDNFYDNNVYNYEKSNIEKSNIEKNVINFPVFFFIYNFDNYYHFLYDTLPYLYTYLHLKKNITDLKLLVNYPNKNMNKFYKFNLELLEKIVDINDLLIHDETNIYKYMYISTSLTHGGYSNNPPRNEIYSIYDKIISNINYDKVSDKYKNIDKIYISRRTHINNDNSNIGTNYTTRRKMINEDEIVNILNNNGYLEIFAENLNIDEKFYLFSNAKVIIGSIGGGMANLLFSKKTTKTIILVTPYFLEINNRFKYSMENTDITYFYDITTYKEDNKIPLYCRANIINKNSEHFGKYGEICDYNKNTNKYLINISNNDVAGFNNLINFSSNWFEENELFLLDNGLNSPYIVNIDNLLQIL